MKRNFSKGTRRQLIFYLGVGAIFSLVLLFIVVPIAALFFHSSFDLFFFSFQDPVVKDALVLSLVTASCSTIIIIIMGTPIAWFNARHHYPGRELVDTMLDLPLVLPPAVAGIALLMAFGRMGIIGQFFYTFGISIAFTTLAVVMAQTFVSAPFFITQARASFEQIDTVYEKAAQTLGSDRIATFFTIIIPLAKPGLIAGAIMTFARSLGEFGATIMFAGNFQGRTQTMPLAIYTAMQGDINASITLSIILVIISFCIMVGVKLRLRRA